MNAIGFKPLVPENLKMTSNGQIDILGVLNPLYDDIDAIPPFYKTDSGGAELLFQAGDDDHNFDSAMYAREAGKLMEENGNGDRCTVEILEGMGHICHLPYSPGIVLFLFGGFVIHYSF